MRQVILGLLLKLRPACVSCWTCNLAVLLKLWEIKSSHPGEAAAHISLILNVRMKDNIHKRSRAPGLCVSRHAVQGRQQTSWDIVTFFSYCSGFWKEAEWDHVESDPADIWCWQCSLAVSMENQGFLLRALNSSWAQFVLCMCVCVLQKTDARVWRQSSRGWSPITQLAPQIQTSTDSPGFWRARWAPWWRRRTWGTLNQDQDHLCTRSFLQTSPGPECTAPRSPHGLETKAHTSALNTQYYSKSGLSLLLLRPESISVY